LTGTLPTVTYTPNEGFIGTDFFNFIVSDGQSASQPGTVLITVEAP
jgi:hypothetical protein